MPPNNETAPLALPSPIVWNKKKNENSMFYPNNWKLKTMAQNWTQNEEKENATRMTSTQAQAHAETEGVAPLRRKN